MGPHGLFWHSCILLTLLFLPAQLLSQSQPTSPHPTTFGPADVPKLIEDLHGDLLVSQKARKELLKLGATAVPKLAEAMADFKGWYGQDQMTRVEEVLAGIGCPAVGALDEILRGVRGNGSNGLRGQAAAVLGETRCVHAVQPLTRALEGSYKDDHFVVVPILTALAKIGSPNSAGPISVRLDDKDRDIRRAAANVLVQLKWIPPDDVTRIKLWSLAERWDRLVKTGLASATVDYLEARLRSEGFSCSAYDDTIGELVGLAKVAETARATGILTSLLKNERRECRHLSAVALKELWPHSRTAIPELLDALRKATAGAYWITEKDPKQRAVGTAAILDGLMTNPSEAPAIKRVLFDATSAGVVRGIERELPERQRDLFRLLYHTRQSIPAGLTDAGLASMTRERNGKRPVIDDTRRLFASPTVLESVRWLESLAPEELRRVVACITAVWGSGENRHGAGMTWAAGSLWDGAVDIRHAELARIAPVVRLLGNHDGTIRRNATVVFQWSGAPPETIELQLPPWGEKDRTDLERLAQSKFELYSSRARVALEQMDRPGVTR